MICIRYFFAWLPILALATTAQAQTKSVQLNQVNVKGEKVKMKKGILGRKKIRHDGGIYMKNGDEVAVYFQPQLRKNAFLKNILIYVTDEGIPKANFKVHVYKYDSDDIGTNLIPPIITHANAGNEWVRLDVGNKMIPVDKGLYISIEWIPDGNDTTLWHQDELSKYNIGYTYDKNYNGQVIGLTWGYHSQQLAFVRTVSHPQEWQSGNLGAASYVGIRYKIKHEINPMVYCTYAYLPAR